MTVGWAVLGTANIAARSFLPALRAAGGGAAVVVGSRNHDRAAAWARENGVESVAAGPDGVGYQQALEDPRVEAVYVALPNTEHRRWAAAALEAGKTVLCEKPLTPSPADTESLLNVARGAPGLLWESFVFPFHPQTDRLRTLLVDGAIGELREIVSSFHFRVRSPDNIRLDPGLAGGAVFDVGCYPIRLARLLFDAEPLAASGSATIGSSGVETDAAAVVDFPGGRRLLLTAGLDRAYDTETRLLGSSGSVRVTNPFHPGEHDAIAVSAEGSGDPVVTEAGVDTAFTHAVAHIHEVLAGRAEPVFLAVDDAAGQAHAVALVRTALGLR
jgi:predicted dehydrogenase